MTDKKFDFSKILNLYKRAKPKQIIFWAVALALGVAALVVTKNVVACWQVTPLAGIPPASCNSSNTSVLETPVVNELGTPMPKATPTPAAAPSNPLPPAWDGASRVNLLFVGLDYGDWSADREGASRSDTMILLTIDPSSKTAGVLSIPRDMWVNIPGYGYGKINTAYYLGEANKLPGGGPALAMKTVEQFIGVPIQYYAQVDFNTFVDIINLIGGIDVNVDQKLILDPLGPGADKVVINAGFRHIDGQRALAFARTRKTEGGDVDRAKRQQQVILGIRNRVLDPKYFPKFVAQAPALYAELQQGIHTNLALDDAIRLAVLAQEIPVDQIKMGVIDYTMMTIGKSPDGLDINKPITDKIRELRDEIFSSNGAVSPKATGDLGALMKAEGARVRVLNGSVANGIAGTTQQYLISQGVNVTDVGNADQIYSRSVIVVYTDKLNTMRYLANLFGVNSSGQIAIKYDPTSPVDVALIVGNDWANSNPMP
jgi:LCP family protein required for cell wall assembly